MAHTPRASNEKRKHPQQWPTGTNIGMMTTGGMAKGNITGYDDGGWIYVNWTFYPTNGGSLPGWARTTHVINLDAANQEGLANAA